MTVEYQHVTGEWRITAYDSRADDDALPEMVPLRGRVHFSARFDQYDRFASVYVPGDEESTAHLLSVRDMVFAVVNGRLQDRQARDGVWLPAVVGGVPIVWTARPELFEDPGGGILGDAVRSDSVTWSPPEAGPDGVRAVDLAEAVDSSTDYAPPVVSMVADLVARARSAESGAVAAAARAQTSAENIGQAARDATRSADAAASSAGAADDSARAASGSADAAAGSAGAAADSADAADVSARAAADSAGAAADSADAADGSARSASESAGAAADSADAAASSAVAADTSADRAAAEADRSRGEADRARAAADAAVVGAPEGGWSRAELAADVRGSLARADTALQDVDVDDVGGLPEALDEKADLVNGVLVTSQIPAVGLTKPMPVADRAALLELVAEEGDVGVITAGPDKGSYMLGAGPSTVFGSWVKLVAPDAPVSSVNGQKGTVNLGAGDVGAAPALHSHSVDQVDGLGSALAGKAPAHVAVFELPATGVPGTLYLERDFGG